MLVKVKLPSPSFEELNRLIAFLTVLWKMHAYMCMSKVPAWVSKRIVCVLGTSEVGQELVRPWDCGGEWLPPACLSMRPADLFIVASDGFHKPNGTDTPLMI